MAEKFNSEEQLDPKELAAHLRQPTGETGKRVGLLMNKGNAHFCLNTYSILSPSAGSRVLEIGMGNGYFVRDLLALAPNLSYVGVDFSPTMVEEAQKINEEFVAQGVANFDCASIEKLPYPENSFDYISTTNTLYFWPEPLANAGELLRVLKPGGKLLVAYRSKDFMQHLEFAKFGFAKYNAGDVERLLIKAGFATVSTKKVLEPELEFEGVSFEMEGFFTSAFKPE